jgi:GNAT superfamily N-acetyltransferase
MTEIQPASSPSRRDFIAALNAAYVGYYVPIHLTLEDFDDLVYRESVQLAHSAAALECDQVVGGALLGVRGQRGWVGGVGVLPDYRRRGIARQMMFYLIEQARSIGITRLQLEVITENEKALALYQGLGFESVRRLLVLSLRDVNIGSDLSLQIVKESADRLLGRLPAFDVSARPWQRDLESLRLSLTLGELEGLAAYHRQTAKPLGMLLFSRGFSHVSIADLSATDPDIGRALLTALTRRMSAARYSYLNVPEEDPMLPMLLAAGFQTTLSQYEMTFHLDQDGS